MKENKRKIHHPDDNLFKKVMEDKTNARAYLEEFYPALAKNLDLDRLQIQSESFLTPQFSAFKSDIIYRCPFKGSEEYVQYALILWEHKSKPKKWVAIQLGLYIFLTLDKMEREKGRAIEPIIPLLFYNGKEKWIPKTLTELFSDFEFYHLIKDFIPSFDFLFKNLVGTPIEKLTKINTAFFRSAMVAMANRESMDLIYSKFSFIFDLGDDYHLEILMTYVLNFTNRSPKEIKNIFKELDLKIDKNRIMSTLDMILKEGEAIGLKRGEEIGIKKGEEIGIKKGEEIGIKKGEEIGKVKERAFLSLTNLLKLIIKFPHLKVAEIANFTEIKPEKINLLLKTFPTKKKKNIQQTINNIFLAKIELSKGEKVKISKLITQILKKK
ncbi:MAG: Rpn family recombination-promoting nuclease/putative transposase [Saprospiraceae bacterium]